MVLKDQLESQVTLEKEVLLVKMDHKEFREMTDMEKTDLQEQLECPEM